MHLLAGFAILLTTLASSDGFAGEITLDYLFRTADGKKSILVVSESGPDGSSTRNRGRGGIYLGEGQSRHFQKLASQRFEGKSLFDGILVHSYALRLPSGRITGFTYAVPAGKQMTNGQAHLSCLLDQRQCFATDTAALNALLTNPDLRLIDLPHRWGNLRLFNFPLPTANIQVAVEQDLNHLDGPIRITKFDGTAVTEFLATRNLSESHASLTYAVADNVTIELPGTDRSFKSVWREAQTQWTLTPVLGLSPQILARLGHNSGLPPVEAFTRSEIGSVTQLCRDSVRFFIPQSE